MATLLGVNATKVAAVPQQLAEQGSMGGRVHSLFDQYTLTAAVAQNDIIKFGGKLPAGARVIEAKFKFSASLDAAAGTVDLGWAASDDGVEAADADGFMDAIDVTGAGGLVLMSDDEGTRPGLFKQFASPVQVQAVATHAGGLDATSGTISVEIQYVID